MVQGDRRLLRILLDMLLENAIHYSPPEMEIEIGARLVRGSETLPPQNKKRAAALILSSPRSENTPLVEVWIQDKGNGIEPEHLSRIFDRFYRVDTRLTREVNGLGLGLALCKQIVALHEGTLWVESDVGAGSVFHMLLPQVDAEETKHVIV